MSVLLWIGVALIGGGGAVLRFTVDGVVSARLGRAFPFGTLVVNLSGALMLGALSGLAPTSDASLLLGTGALGAYTTFSTWMLESHRLVEGGRRGGAAANIVVSLVLGVAAAALGRRLGMLL